MSCASRLVAGWVAGIGSLWGSGVVADNCRQDTVIARRYVLGHPFVQTEKSSLSSDGLNSRMAHIRIAACRLWPTACVFAALITLTVLLVLGTRASGNSNAVGFYTPVASSFGALYCLPVIAVLLLFRMGKLRGFSCLASAALCVLVIACSVFQSVSGSSRSLALYITCFIEIGCISAWCLFARQLPSPECFLESCVAIVLYCLMTVAFLTTNYLVMACIGLPVFLPILPIAVHFLLCKYARSFLGSSSEDESLSKRPCPVDARALAVSGSLGLAFSCLFSLFFRPWLNTTVPGTPALGLMCCGCLLAVGVLALFVRRVSACLVAPLLFCGAALLLGVLMSSSWQSMLALKLVLFTGGVVCAAFVLMSVVPSLFPDDDSACLNSLGVRLVLVAVACSFFVPTLEVVGALLHDRDLLIQLCLLSLVVYGASCYWLHAMSVKHPRATQPNDLQSNAMPAIAQKYGLTPREADVLEGLFNGRTAPYIARDLSVSINTVRSHAKHIYTKLSVHSQQELIDLIMPLVSTEKNSGKVYQHK